MTAVAAAQWTVRVAGLIALVLGLVIWVGQPTGLRPVHMLVGVVLVVGLVLLAVLGLRAGIGPVLPAVAIAWAIVVPIFGMSQETIMPGDMHVVVEVAHLLVGVVAIGIGEAIAARIGRVAATA